MDGASELIIGSLERMFYWWGKFVTRHPYPVILSCITITALAATGFLSFRMEHRANLLWIPLTSEYNTNQNWLENNFKKTERVELVMFKSENVLTPKAIKKMFALHKQIEEITVDGKSFDDICSRVPIANIFQTKRRRKREVNEEEYDDDIWGGEYYEYTDGPSDEQIKELYSQTRIDFKVYGNRSGAVVSSQQSLTEGLPDTIYCDLVTTLNEKCLVTSLLEMWRFSESNIETTSQQEILDAVNLLTRSPWFGYDRDFSQLLGGIVRNSTGHIVSAETCQMVWSIKVPDDVEIVDNQGSGLELELADKTSLDWEEAFIQTVLNNSQPEALMFPNAVKSFGDISAGALLLDAWLMIGGYLLMFTYTILMLGRLNSLEVRLYLSVAGILGVGMGLVISMGVSSMLGYPYTPMHAMLPFLCLGIGIDDMFVIVQCWANLRLDPSTSITERMGLSLKHAGVSVTITSLTDIFAFGVGAVTRMPGLESFCVGTAIGLAAIYLLQVSWFVAWMSLDECRVAAGRDGLIPCLVHQEGSKGLTCISTGQSSWTLARVYSNILSSNIFRIFIILVTLVFFGVGAWGWSRMKMKFDPVLLLPGDSYLRGWIDINSQYYPNNGWGADVYSKSFNHTDLASINRLVDSFDRLKQSGGLRDVDCWWTKMKQFASEETSFTSWEQFATEDNFSLVLSDFLFSSHGAQYKHNFVFETPLTCNQPAPNIRASKFSIGYYVMEEPEQHMPARHAVEAVLEDAGAPYAFSHSKVYAAWETDTIIGYELWRNIGLAMAAVFTVTLLLLANFRICFFVICIVIITLTDIVGFLHFWGITIDIISCVNIVLAIGLCVDYSVHIGLAFMVARGDRQQKAVEAIVSIGPAVFNGGFTTFLALVLCALSTLHVFVTFFKVFVLTVVFGLFHGLLLFPVILTMIGPTTHVTDDPSQGASNLTISSGQSSSKVSPTSSPQSGLTNIAFMTEMSGKPGLLEPWGTTGSEERRGRVHNI